MVRASWLAVVLLLGAACRTVVPVTPLSADDPRPAQALARWAEVAEQRQALRGRAQLAVDGAEDSVRLRARQVVVLERPARLRIEVLGFLNQTAAVVTTDGEHYEVFRSGDRSYESGLVRPDLLWREAHIGLTPGEAVELLLGVSTLAGGIDPRSGVETADGWIRFDLLDPEGRRVRQASFDGSSRLRSLEAFGVGGEPRWTAHYDRYEMVAGEPFAHGVVLEVAAGGTRVEISLRDVELNPELPADIFSLRGPSEAGAQGGGGVTARYLAIACSAWIALIGCTNDPYPNSDASQKVRYKTLPGPTKTLDPAVSYSALEHQITANVYETLLEYHYLKRPYTFIPGLALEVPKAVPLGDGRVSYEFELRPGILFQSDPSFALAGDGRDTRAVTAADIAFELMRIADPAVTSPVIATFAKIDGFREFADRLQELRDGDPAFAELRIDEQYARAGGMPGVRVDGDTRLTIVLSEPYPQILYWFAMPFTTPVPWEAVEFYDGEEGRPFFKDHPVGAGPFQVAHFDKRSRIVLSRNPNWYGAMHPEWGAPGAVYPSEGEPIDEVQGRLAPDYVGRPLPFLDRIDFRMEKEHIPAFNKFLQGYYDASGVIHESFDKVVHEGGLSPDMKARGMKLEKSVDPDIYYIGFNMNDAVIGTPAEERGRLLRQAMSLAIDVEEYTRIFSNGRGVAAQSPIPPGIYGYEEEYENPFRQPDLERARELLREAGYADGIDPGTGKPLHLSFDLGDTSTNARLRFQFFADRWAQLGLDVEISATNYNKFRQKVKEGAYQIFMWGWIADYPDPENFLFLLWGPMAQAVSGGPNTANFDDPAFNERFLAMKDLENGPRRLEIIREIRAILERERPWIELFHRENYALYHQWMRNVKPAGLSLPSAKYVDLDDGLRGERRREWNRPVRWPAYALAGLAVVIVVPGILTFLRERQ